MSDDNVTCPFCGNIYTVEESKYSCGGCKGLSGGCTKLKCPKCSYEVPAPAELPAKIAAAYNKATEMVKKLWKK
jgi:hypothetical protein